MSAYCIYEYVTANILHLVHKMAQDQKKQDDNVRDLVESLREMAGAASSCPHLRRINGTTDVIKEIGKVSLEVAMLVHDYVNPSIRGHTKFLGLCYFSLYTYPYIALMQIGQLARTVAHTLTDISSRIASSQKRCKELTEKFDRRVLLDVQHNEKSLLPSA